MFTFVIVMTNFAQVTNCRIGAFYVCRGLGRDGGSRGSEITQYGASIQGPSCVTALHLSWHYA